MPNEIRRIVQIGAGGVGFWMATCLARDSRGRELVVYDSDTFEGGYGAQRLPKVYNKQEFKVGFLKGFVPMVMGDVPPTVMSRKFTVHEASQQRFDDTLIVDCTDMDLGDRKDLWAYCRILGATMLRVSYDGAAGGIVVVSRGLPLSSKPGGGYTEKPDLALSMWAGGVGARAVLRLLDGLEVGDQQFQFEGGQDGDHS